MERPQRRPERDINDLLANGFFTTSRGRSPLPTPTPPPLSHNDDNDVPAFLRTTDRNVGRSRSKSRVSRRWTPPPRPIVEDEAVSLSKEYLPTYIPSYDPPSRGTIEQYPVILESDISEAEAQKLHSEPRPKESKESDDNPERRFVLVPGPDPVPSNKHKSEHGQPKSKPDRGNTGTSKDEDRRDRNTDGPVLKPPPLERKRSRQDLPNLQTKVPREIPSQYRRSASAYGHRDRDETPKAQATPQTSTGEYFLSPDTMYAPRPSRPYSSQENSDRRGTSTAEKRNSGSSFSNISRPGTPLSEKSNGGNMEASNRSRRNTNDKIARPPQFTSEELRRSEKQQSNQSDHWSGSERGRSSRRRANSNLQNCSSSEDDFADSGSERHFGRTRREHRRMEGLRPEDDYERQKGSPRSNKSSLHSRLSTPLPSPKVSPNQLPRTEIDRSETFPQGRRPSPRPVSPLNAFQETPRANRLNPFDPGLYQRPSSRQSNAPGPISMPQMPDDPMPLSPLPIPIPTRIDLHSPGETRRTPTVPQYEDDKPSNSRHSHWQPPPFQPPSLEKPIGTYRRYSEDIERGSVKPLPSCPRTNPVRGLQDWFTLPGCPNFDICPDCFHSIISPTVFRDHFEPAARRTDIPIVCDFGSSPWYRIAWLLTLKERRKDLGIFYGLANVALTEEACLGKHDAYRNWNSIRDPRTGSLIKNFDVCSSCVKSIETLLPSIRGIFLPTENGHTTGIPRICDLRLDSKRFIQYFDALETTADDASYHNATPDTRSLAKLARKFSLVDECQGSTELPDRRWHIITQLPEFTVCEECFDDVILPEMKDGKAIALMFNRTPQRLQNASCQLYSERMREIFKRAVNTDDYKMLATKARERRQMEREYKVNVAATKRSGKQSMVGLNGNSSVLKEIQRLGEEWSRWE